MQNDEPTEKSTNSIAYEGVAGYHALLAAFTTVSTVRSALDDVPEAHILEHGKTHYRPRIRTALAYLHLEHLTPACRDLQQWPRKV